MFWSMIGPNNFFPWSRDQMMPLFYWRLCSLSHKLYSETYSLFLETVERSRA